MKEYMLKIKDHDCKWHMEFFDEYSDAVHRKNKLGYDVAFSTICVLYNGRYYWDTSLEDDLFDPDDAEYDVIIDGIWYHHSCISGYERYAPINMGN